MAWLVTLLGLVVRRVFTLVFGIFVFKVAQRIAIASAAILLAATLTLAMASAIKGLIVAARVTMPNTLGLATYFLPSDINVLVSVFVTIRVTHFIWSWTMKNLARFTMTVHL